MMTIDEFISHVDVNNLLPDNEGYSLRVTDHIKNRERFITMAWGKWIPIAVRRGMPVVFSLTDIDLDNIKLHDIVAGPITSSHYVRLTGEIVPVDKNTNWEAEWKFIRFALGTSKGIDIKYEQQL
jgi:hypothetical protein